MTNLYANLISVFLLGVAGLAHADDGVPNCPLFVDGHQKLDGSGIEVTSIKPVLLLCEASGTTAARVATRKLQINGESFLLLADPQKLSTSIERESCWKCRPTSVIGLIGTRLGSALFRLTEVDDPKAASQANMGLKKAERDVSGSFVTGDLCPSLKPLDREFFKELASGPGPTPVALAVTGRWMETHGADFLWLKEQVQDGKLEITWVNHSFHHPFVPHTHNHDNFLLAKGSNLGTEILETEKLLIERGTTPSVFFRFPGLVSNDALMEEMRSFGLIPVGTSAWLAKGDEPHSGSIVLVHPNGNEPRGIQLFAKLMRERRLPMPLLPIFDAPSADAKPTN